MKKSGVGTISPHRFLIGFGMYISPEGHSCYLVALEGPDRLGKSTQAKLLEDAMKESQIRGIVEKSPYADGPICDRIYQMLYSGEAVSQPVVFQTLMGINRLSWQQQHLPNLAYHFDVIVLDRWSPSTWVYGAESGVPDETTSCVLQGLIEPDLVLVFDGEAFPSPDADDSYEADERFQRNIRQRYRDWAQGKIHVRWLDARQEVSAVTEEILGHIRWILR